MNSLVRIMFLCATCRRRRNKFNSVNEHGLVSSDAVRICMPSLFSYFYGAPQYARWFTTRDNCDGECIGACSAQAPNQVQLNSHYFAFEENVSLLVHFLFERGVAHPQAPVRELRVTIVHWIVSDRHVISRGMKFFHVPCSYTG